MKARQKRRVAGPTTGCSPGQAPCIEEKQRVSPTAVRHTQKNKQKMNKYIHELTRVTVVYIRYVCLYTGRERIRVRQPAVRYTHKSKTTNMDTRVCLCMYMCMRSESESASHSSPPQLKGVSDDRKSTRSLKHSITVLNHDKHAHSPKR
jgi:hypothetical protein